MKMMSRVLCFSMLLLLLVSTAGNVYAESPEFPREESVKVKVMSYNIHHAEGVDGELDLGRIAEVIKESKADVIGLQEVDNHWSSRSDFQDQAKQLAERLDMFYAYGANLDIESSDEDEPNRQYGTAILSSYPILESENHFLPKIGDTEQRGLLEARINVKGTHINVFNTHLALTTEERNLQVEEIIDIANEADGPNVIMGDLNALPDSEELQPLYHHYQDAFADQPEAYTYPAADPTKRIDYIFTSNALKPSQSVVMDTLASDHLPITTDIYLNRSVPFKNGK
ncbi:Metal-dependent hydrolase, endonuclease/exonuclease/phosphatase family [Thalassobacillus cyri]|uniref:Metal-dependent hydrolase, endonuclease/exonuclease/phosphatase family n=1 Tax=Thalassobacillus cyri TaxID=571932 RepID=A0A1H3VUD8_9BACI|nr:endonuclease/exonuclease/phosphatase family protein [Thalassobacillus cyri]SDZ78465.1 Metal-dependent hydrolase, endonuclease/exonuclease/phosphatase family [Thalassobacillus cyri]